MGAVYKAEQPSMQRFVAIKILHKRYVSRPDLMSRFRREARAMSHLSHPNIARVYMYGELEDGSAYIVMEFLEGSNVARAVQREGPMDPKRAIHIMVQVCDALGEAHQAGMVHRDLKPENIFLCNDEARSDYPKVLDFGLAKVTERELQPGSVFLTREGAIFGTPEFMSPEQAQGKVLDARSDIYSLSIILYEMLTGELPFYAGQPVEYMQRHVYDPPIPLQKRAPGRLFPKGLHEALAQAMQKDPQNRFQSAREFADVLSACIGESKGSAQQLGAAKGGGITTARPWTSRTRSWIIVALATAGILGLVIWAISRL
ncbi:MAG: serine/threonine protein kinase [Myxococcales bacterium]|nr:serine/threonine protein kinase [Myxococcales bacterium]MCB9707926.1 serine/threonine protein kinase [Myxococcales bacterium]